MTTRYRMHDGRRYKVVVYDGFEGFVVRWTATCTGCCETEDGHHVGHYDFDEKAKCHLGAGCEECGYHGKVRREEWVPFDTKAYSKHIDEQWTAEQRMRRTALAEGLTVTP